MAAHGLRLCDYIVLCELPKQPQPEWAATGACCHVLARCSRHDWAFPSALYRIAVMHCDDGTVLEGWRKRLACAATSGSCLFPSGGVGVWFEDVLSTELASALPVHFTSRVSVGSTLLGVVELHGPVEWSEFVRHRCRSLSLGEFARVAMDLAGAFSSTAQTSGFCNGIPPEALRIQPCMTSISVDRCQVRRISLLRRLCRLFYLEIACLLLCRYWLTEKAPKTVQNSLNRAVYQGYCCHWCQGQVTLQRRMATCMRPSIQWP